MPPKKAAPVVRLSVNVTAELHEEVRINAERQGQTISEFVRASLETSCAEKKRKADQ